MEIRSHEQRKGLLALVTGLSAISLIFTGFSPAYALTGGDSASGAEAKSVARIEVPVEETYTDTALVSPYITEAEEKAYKCEDGYSASGILTEGSVCFETKPAEQTGGSGPYACPVGFKAPDGAPVDAGTNCVGTAQKPVIEDVSRTKPAKYDCPAGYENAKGTPLDEKGVCKRIGGKAVRTKIRVCTGVLLEEQIILGIRSCLTAGDPYKLVIGDKKINQLNLGKDVISQKVTGPAKVTFGAESMPGAEKTFWANTVLPDSATQMVRVRLDRPVPSAVATPIKRAAGPVASQQSLKVFGWQEDPGTPQLQTKNAEVGLSYVVNSLAPEPRGEQQSWDDYIRTHSGFKDASHANTIGIIDDVNVRKGFVLKDTNMSESDLGAPAFNNAGEFAGLYIGANYFIDTGEQRTNQFIYGRKGSPSGDVKYPPVMTDPYAAYSQMQNMICTQGKVLPNGKEIIEGTSKSLADQNVAYAALHIGNGTDVADTKGGGTDVYKYTDGLTCEGADVDANGPTVGKALRWADKIEENINTAISDLEKRVNQANDARSRALTERTLYNEALEQINGAVTGFNPDSYDNCRSANPTPEGAVACLSNYGNNLPLDVLNGKKSPTGGDIIPSATAKAEALEPSGQNAEPLRATGTVMRDWLQERADTLAVQAKRKTTQAKEYETKANNLAKESDKKDKLKAYLGGVKQQLKKVLEDSLSSIEPAQTQWETEWQNEFKKFDDDYKEYDELTKEIVAQNSIIETNSSFITSNNCDSLPPDDPQHLGPRCGEARNNRTAAETRKAEAIRKASAPKFASWSPAPAEVTSATQNIVPVMTPYKPKHELNNIQDITKGLPKYVLYAHHMDQVMQGILGDLQTKGFKDQGTIDAIARKVKGRLVEGTQAENEAVGHASYTTIQSEELQKLFERVPDSLKPFAKDKIGAAAAARRETSKALQVIRDAKATLQDLANKAAKAPSTDAALQYDKESQDALDQAKNSLNTAQQNRETIRELKDELQDMIDGKIADPSKPGTKPLTPAEKAKAEKEKAEAAKKAAEAKKKAEAEAAKKAAEEKRKADAEKKKTEAEAKKKAALDKKDEARLAKALSMNTMRADGDNRTLTSIAAWKRGYFPGDTVLIVDGRVAADGISATPLAAALGAPILLTTWQTGLEPAIIDQLKASDKKHVLLIGGKVNVSPNDEFELNEAGIDVSRISGPDRYATAVAVNQAAAKHLNKKAGQPLELYLGDGIGFPDALSAGAAAGRNRSIMLLSKGDSIDPNVRNYMVQLGTTRPLHVTAVGGPAARAMRKNPWPANLSVTTKNVIGADRYATSAMLASQLAGTSGVVLASGENFADALPGGALAADQNSALILSRSKELPQPTYEALRRQGADKTIVMGGEKAISRKVAELVNGAKIDDINKIEGTLAERKKLQERVAAEKEKAKNDALEELKQQLGQKLKKDPKSLDEWLRKNLGLPTPGQLAAILKNTPGK